jgi:hypothetical protein
MLSSLTPLLLVAGPLVFTSGTEAPRRLEQRQAALERGGRVGKLTCATYPDFTVKELDLGGLGAEVLAIVPRDRKRRGGGCTAERSPGELSVSADGWSGYFEGAAGPYAFFRSVDARAGAFGFAAYDARTGRRAFADAAVGPVVVNAGGGRVGLSWVKAAVAPCSPLADGEACWSRIKAELGVADPAPDCAEAYRKANEAAAQAACKDEPEAGPRCVERELRLRPAYPPLLVPTLGYEVKVRDLGAEDVRPAAGGRVVSCEPAD